MVNKLKSNEFPFNRPGNFHIIWDSNIEVVNKILFVIQRTDLNGPHFHCI